MVMKLDPVPFQALVKARCGLPFEGNDEQKLLQALTERIGVLGIHPDEYYPCLCSDAAEFQTLVNLLTINETYFFREPEQIHLLVDRIVPRLLALRPASAPIRILSAGCSSGEEPYSLVMALTEKYGASTPRLFRFFGCDIDSTVLAKARKGHYTDFSFRGVSAEIRQRHFSDEQREHVLHDDIRSQVSFHELNLLADPPPATPEDFDIVFFRNVSIYFDTATRKRIQQNLARLMRPDGILVIGTAETLANNFGILPLVEESGLFYFAKGHPPLPSAAPVVSVAPVAPAAAPPPILRLSTPDDWKPTPTPPTPPAPPADAVPAEDRRLLRAHDLLNRRDFSACAALAQAVLAEDEWSVDALLLLGLADKWRGNAGQAIRWFRQAVYARHECWPAHYYLAGLYRDEGENELARRAYRVVLQLLANTTVDTGIRHIPLDLPVGEIRFLCSHRLENMPGPAAAPATMGQG